MTTATSTLLPANELVRSERISQDVVRTQSSHELVFGVVGHIGSGASEIAEQLRTVLARSGFDAHILKAREVITRWAELRMKSTPAESNRRTVAHVSTLQDFGDEMRHEAGDHAAVARALVSSIRTARANATSVEVKIGEPIQPDKKHRAYILDSIRHPAEVDLLRHLYRSAFVLLGVVCEEEQRERRITEKFSDAGRNQAQKLMARDAKAPEKWGQRVSDAFHLADVFLDNSAQRIVEAKPNPDWNVPDQLDRLVKLLTRSHILRATPHEVAMYIAYGAQMRSACLSRQVGAALISKDGIVVATGTNEVPRAGGGVYGVLAHDHDVDELADHRCAFTDLHAEKYCSNTREQREIVQELVDALKPHLEKLSKDTMDAFASNLIATNSGAAPTISGLLEARVRDLVKDTAAAVASALPSSRIGGLLEFSRAVHAEMDAILAATRNGASIAGGRLYVTTFPCHYCARHIVAAGLDEVQYIEPYPKSKALKLHADAITTSSSRWRPPSKGGDKVLIRPFAGIAPRLYERVFLKETDLKDADGNLKIGELPWGDRWNVQRISYAQLEAELTREMEEQDVEKGLG